jgi:Holliday junction resolvasome RuvABC ATP-dependent DNA helicase subunit
MTPQTRLDDDRVLSVLENAIEWMEDPDNQERMNEYGHVGFEAADVNAGGWEFKKLMQTNLIERVYNSNAASYYRVVELEQAKAVVEATQSPTPTSDASTNGDDITPDELFTDVVGRDKVKKWLRRTVANDEQVHHLLAGPPGSGKSMIADDIAALLGAQRVVLSGDGSTAVGIRDTLLDNPPYLVVEEIEKGTKHDREALMTACGEGYVKVTKSGMNERVDVDTVVVATSNDVAAITPASLRDRLLEWEFAQYDAEEFGEVCAEVLPADHDISESLAQYIATQVYDRLGSTQVRDAKHVASLAETENEVMELVASMQ